jgi:SAM-dependent methyltransferase
MLDVGCATGALTERIRQRYGFARAVGVDFVPEVLEMGRATYPDVEFQEATLPILPFVDAEFDLVVASEVLYYLTLSAQEQALQEMARVLKPSGYLLVGSALGGAYFTPEGARSLLMRQFELVAEDALRMHAYHALVNPFYYANRLDSLLTSGAAPGSEAMRARYQRLRPVLNNFPIYQLIRGLALLGRPVLASQGLPATANALTRLGRRSNITLLGLRR